MLILSNRIVRKLTDPLQCKDSPSYEFLSIDVYFCKINISKIVVITIWMSVKYFHVVYSYYRRGFGLGIGFIDHLYVQP